MQRNGLGHAPRHGLGAVRWGRVWVWGRVGAGEGGGDDGRQRLSHTETRASGRRTRASRARTRASAKRED